MRKNDEWFMVVAYGIYIFILLAFAAFILWAKLSLVTSAVKAIAGSCDQTYVVEGVLSGDWFCPVKEQK